MQIFTAIYIIPFFIYLVQEFYTTIFTTIITYITHKYELIKNLSIYKLYNTLILAQNYAATQNYFAYTVDCS